MKNIVLRIFGLVILMIMGAIIWDIASASPGLKLQIPPYPAEIFKLTKHGDPRHIFTWDECLRTRDEIIIGLIADRPDIEEAIDNGEVIVECVELDADGELYNEPHTHSEDTET